MKTAAYAATAAHQPLVPFVLDRREPGPEDVAIDILYCGLCHSDILQARNELGHTRYPLVPGHEIVGRVARVGDRVTRFSEGDLVGVGGIHDSCRECAYCRDGLEMYCAKGASPTYGGTEMDRRTPTYGGYSKHIVVAEPYVLKVPTSLDPAAAAPLLCAGITTYSALRQWNVKKGDHVGVVGLGGVGHVAVKIAAAMGAEVTVLSTSRSKQADAQRLGAQHFALNTDAESMRKLASRLDVILDAAASPQHDFSPLLGALKPFGALVVLGFTAPSPVSALSLIMGSKRVAGSAIGGIRENQEMLNFCGEHGVVADIELVSASQINASYERMIRGDVRYRFVLDAATL